MQLLLIACSLAGMIICGVTWGQNRPAPPADDLRGAPGKPGWAVDERSGCWLWNADPQPGETVTWSSGCGPDGLANGRGILEWRSDGKTERYEGDVTNGRRNGFIYERLQAAFTDSMQHFTGVIFIRSDMSCLKFSLFQFSHPLQRCG